MNAAPVIKAPASAQTLGKRLLSISDADAHSQVETVTLRVSQGTLLLSRITGLVFECGFENISSIIRNPQI